MLDPRVLDPGDLRAAVLDARSTTLGWVDPLDDGQLRAPPTLATINPLLWEIGHVAWFQEHWTCRRDGAPSTRRDADSLYDSIRIPHEVRWHLPLPDRDATVRYCEETRDRALTHLDRHDDPESRFHQAYSVFHEDMHAEAFGYTFQTLGWRPALDHAPAPQPESPADGDVAFLGARMRIGAAPDEGMVFDNEKWGHEVEVAPFQIARTPVTQGQYLEFVLDGGYDRDDLWSPAGRAFRTGRALTAPVYWRRDGDSWSRRAFDRWRPLELDHPMIHVSFYEAEAFCEWAGRRLPTEVEWEAAALFDPSSGQKRRFPWGDLGDAARVNADVRFGGTVSAHALAAGDSPIGCRQMLGNIWEWTDDWFAPFPGFTPDPYASYSRISFHFTRVLKGGSFLSRSRLLRGAYRNFFAPVRNDIPAGFRTCAR